MIPTENKSVFESKTVWGVIVMLLAANSENWFGVKFDTLSDFSGADSLTVLAGGALAIYGRMKANIPIGKENKNG